MPITCGCASAIRVRTLLTTSGQSCTFGVMGRPLRVSLGGYVYHVLNRGNGRTTLFYKDGDYDAFERILTEALQHVPGMRLLAYCLMPNHWHLVLLSAAAGEVG